MNATKTRTRWCWRTDLAEFRELTNRERSGFLPVLEWFESFRLRQELEAGAEAALFGQVECHEPRRASP